MVEVYGSKFTSQFGDIGGPGYETWLNGLSDIHPDQFRFALEKCAKSGSAWPPNLVEFRSLCQDLSLYGLPSLDRAYREAANVSYPITAHRWSHPAVYHAGGDVGWFELRNNPESVSKKKFAEHYAARCQQVMNGVVLEAPIHEAIEKKEIPASRETREQYMANIKALLSA